LSSRDQLTRSVVTPSFVTLVGAVTLTGATTWRPTIVVPTMGERALAACALPARAVRNHI
jgi:hypothetical protein